MTSLTSAINIRERRKTESSSIAYSIGTLVRDVKQYEAMRKSFIDHGFGEADCEYLFVDNTGDDQLTAYKGLNLILNNARGQRVILCHQDIRLLNDDRKILDERLSQLEVIDSKWALAGNAGAIGPKAVAIRITDPHGVNQHVGELPAKVISLDENFMVVRKEARVGFSNDLEGFHFYGADICLNADILGLKAYVIDFHLHHLSGGKIDDAFYKCLQEFKEKWDQALRRRNMMTTTGFEFRLKGHL